MSHFLPLHRTPLSTNYVGLIRILVCLHQYDRNTTIIEISDYRLSYCWKWVKLLSSYFEVLLSINRLTSYLFIWLLKLHINSVSFIRILVCLHLLLRMPVRDLLPQVDEKRVPLLGQTSQQGLHLALTLLLTHLIILHHHQDLVRCSTQDITRLQITHRTENNRGDPCHILYLQEVSQNTTFSGSPTEALLTMTQTMTMCSPFEHFINGNGAI